MQRLLTGFILCLIGLWAMGCAQTEQIDTANVDGGSPAIEGPAFVLLYTDN